MNLNMENYSGKKYNHKDYMGLFDGVALGLDCTPRAQLAVWCHFPIPRPDLRELERPSCPGFTRMPFFSVSLEHGSAELQPSDLRQFCTTGQACRCKPNTKMRTGRAHELMLQTWKVDLFSPGFGWPEEGWQAGLGRCRWANTPYGSSLS
jgi:hypothetical protein